MDNQLNETKPLVHSEFTPIINFTPLSIQKPEINRKKFLLAGRGGLGEEIGRGREKVARTVGSDKVLVTYHGKENQELATPSFTKAQFYMHKVLHTLLPNNFPDVFAGGDDAILVERIPDSDDLTKAREINKLYLDSKKHYLIETDQRDWWQKKTRDAYDHPEYKRAIAIMQAMGLGFGTDNDPYELAQPVNTTFIDGHPVLLEMMKPIISTDNGKIIPRMDIEELAEVVREGVEMEFLDEKAQNKILSYAIRYEENAKKAAADAATLAQSPIQ